MKSLFKLPLWEWWHVYMEGWSTNINGSLLKFAHV